MTWKRRHLSLWENEMLTATLKCNIFFFIQSDKDRRSNMSIVKNHIAHSRVVQFNILFLYINSGRLFLEIWAQEQKHCHPHLKCNPILMFETLPIKIVAMKHTKSCHILMFNIIADCRYKFGFFMTMT